MRSNVCVMDVCTLLVGEWVSLGWFCVVRECGKNLGFSQAQGLSLGAPRAWIPSPQRHGGDAEWSSDQTAQPLILGRMRSVITSKYKRTRSGQADDRVWYSRQLDLDMANIQAGNHAIQGEKKTQDNAKNDQLPWLTLQHWLSLQRRVSLARIDISPPQHELRSVTQVLVWHIEAS